MRSLQQTLQTRLSRKGKGRQAERARISVGICAMDKKVKSKPMQEILRRLQPDIFEVIVFGDHCILDTPVEDWPLCEALIAFYSNRFPLEKAERYAELRKPFMLNDLSMQRKIQDRRNVYRILQEIGVDVPRHEMMNRDDPNAQHEIVEYDEYILINGVQMNKPFVEKPVDAEDHNIYIYYPLSAGGGSKRLFRKIGDRSSEFYRDVNEVRRDGSYIYEEFVETQGTDVKVYTVGPHYGHAEARKSPVIDGRVNRDAHGKELRFPVILSAAEKEVARKVTIAFGQTVCGFDLLRVQGKSYVCDVNGWSFVKTSRKYYDDCAQILSQIMIQMTRPAILHTLRMSEHSQQAPPRMGPPSPTSSESSVDSSANFEDSKARFKKTRAQREELRCVIAIIRHGDRTPKQKMKMKVSVPCYIQYFHKHSSDPRKDLKVKSKADLTEFLEVTRTFLRAYRGMGLSLQSNLIEGSNASAITPDFSTITLDPQTTRPVPVPEVAPDVYRKILQIRDVLERWKISGINRKLQMKPRKWSETQRPGSKGVMVTKATELQLILKWGGDLTPLGMEQAENLGRRFRHNMYPDLSGGGVLRLHATFRHDLKIKASDEGRVIKTAAAFTKGLLELEGELTPIMVSLVRTEKESSHMLDHSGNIEIKNDIERCKLHLHNMLQLDVDLSEDHISRIAPAAQSSVKNALRNIGNPRRCLMRMYNLIGNLLTVLEEMCERFIHEAASMDATTLSDDTAKGRERSPTPDSEILEDSVEIEPELCGMQLYIKETPMLMLERWRKLYMELYDDKTDQFDLTKVPDVHDNIRYDILHNGHLDLPNVEELYVHAKNMADCVVPQEYGIDQADKRIIGSKTCRALLEKVKSDLITARTDNNNDMRYVIDESHGRDLLINSLGRRVRTRLYFTSESHLHTFLNVLRFPELPEFCPFTHEGCNRLAACSELCYLTQIVIRVFEDTEKLEDDPKRFRVEISFSPGADGDPLSDSQAKFSAPTVHLNRSLTCWQMEACLHKAIEAGQDAHDDDCHEWELSSIDSHGGSANVSRLLKSESEVEDNFVMQPEPNTPIRTTWEPQPQLFVADSAAVVASPSEL